MYVLQCPFYIEITDLHQAFSKMAVIQSSVCMYSQSAGHWACLIHV